MLITPLPRWEARTPKVLLPTSTLHTEGPSAGFPGRRAHSQSAQAVQGRVPTGAIPSTGAPSMAGASSGPGPSVGGSSSGRVGVHKANSVILVALHFGMTVTNVSSSSSSSPLSYFKFRNVNLPTRV